MRRPSDGSLSDSLNNRQQKPIGDKSMSPEVRNPVYPSTAVLFLLNCSVFRRGCINGRILRCSYQALEVPVLSSVPLIAVSTKSFLQLRYQIDFKDMKILKISCGILLYLVLIS